MWELMVLTRIVMTMYVVQTIQLHFFSFVLMISARSVCPEHSLVLNVLTIYPADIGVRTPAVTNKTFHSTVKTMFTTPFLLPSYMSSLVLGVNQ